MTDFMISEEAVEAYKRKYRENYVDGKILKVDERIARALAAALPVMFERVGKVCMNGNRYGHGLFADIEVQYDSMQSPAPKIGSDIFQIKESK
jgi:hypothetical protein